MAAPNPVRASREDAPARCQPSSAPRRDPRQRLWAGGAGEAGCAGTCQDRSGAAAAGLAVGRGIPAPMGAGTALGTWYLAPCQMGAASGQLSAPSPTLSAMNARFSAPAPPPLPTQPCTTCFSSSSVEGKQSPAIPSPPLPRAGKQGAPLLSRSNGAGGEESWGGVPWGHPPLPGPLPPPTGRWDPLHYQAADWGRGMRPSTEMGTRAAPPQATPHPAASRQG